MFDFIFYLDPPSLLTGMVLLILPAASILYVRRRLRCKTAVEARIVDYPICYDDECHVHKLLVRYMQNGKEYRVVPSDSPKEILRNAADLYEQYPIDSTLTVYIDPARPDNAYIFPEMSPSENILSLAFVCFCLFGLFFILLSAFGY